MTPRGSFILQHGPMFPIRGALTYVLILLLTLWAVDLSARVVPGAQQPPKAQQPSTQRGWVMFDDSVGKAVGIPAQQLTQLQALDKRYEPRYLGLGEEPWTNTSFPDLTEARNAEIRSILGEDLYTKWNTRINVPRTSHGIPQPIGPATNPTQPATPTPRP